MIKRRREGCPAKHLRILFLCTTNAARGPMAEAVARHVALTREAASDPLRLEAASAGSEPAAQIDPLAIATLAAHGIETPGPRLKAVSALHGQRFDYVVVVGVAGEARARARCLQKPRPRADASGALAPRLPRAGVGATQEHQRAQQSPDSPGHLPTSLDRGAPRRGNAVAPGRDSVPLRPGSMYFEEWRPA
ncbi:MAG: hypothetical protein ACLP1X_30885 [Polyangiaceae bacterium]